MRWIGAVFLLAAAPGCFLSHPAVTRPKPLSADGYVSTSSPENVLVNLAVSHRRRELRPYADLLAPEYRFRFSTADNVDLGRAALSRTEDSLATGALFGSGAVEDIGLTLPPVAPVPAAGVRFLPGTMVIRVNAPELQVTLSDGTQWRVSNPQEFYVRPGLSANGEDPSRWFLLEWDEFATEPKPGPPEAPSPEPVRGLSWGALKLMFWGGA